MAAAIIRGTTACLTNVVLGSGVKLELSPRRGAMGPVERQDALARKGPAPRVWSLALRRAKRIDDGTTRELAELIQEGRAVLLGVVRQELLSGIKDREQFELLRDHLRAFPNLELETGDYEEGAAAFNRCRSRGIQGSNTDSLICSAAWRRDLAIFTTSREK